MNRSSPGRHRQLSFPALFTVFALLLSIWILPVAELRFAIYIWLPISSILSNLSLLGPGLLSGRIMRTLMHRITHIWDLALVFADILVKIIMRSGSALIMGAFNPEKPILDCRRPE